MKKQRKFISAVLVFLLILQTLVFISTSNASAAGGALKVQMYTENTSPTADTISPNFRIYNYGVNALNLSFVRLRYYFTKDSSSTQNFVCDSCVYNNSDIQGVTGNFTDMTSPTSNADNYLEISFSENVTLAPNSSIELKTRIFKSDGSNYNQSNDYSFNSDNSGYIDWNKVTASILNTLLWGCSPDAQPAKGFLVIVSSKIYRYCSNELNQYMNDLSNEGWTPTLIKVNNEPDELYNNDSGFYVCQSPQELKQIIKGYYTQGYQGLVLVGSAPSIPSAYWKPNPGSSEKGPTDLYYADMDDWYDIDGDGAFDSYYNDDANPGSPDKKRPANPSNPVFSPDMVIGRISAGAISDSEQQEGIKTAAYLSKIHDLRARGGVLNFDPKAFCFTDDNFANEEHDRAASLKDLEKEIYSAANYASTNTEKFFQFLQGGYRIGYEVIHADQTGWAIYAHPNGTEDSTIHEYPSIEDINGMTVKVNYLHLSSCSACDYTTNNLGAAFLFNNADTYSTLKNSYVYNVTGMTIPAMSFLDAQYFQDLKSECIGTAYKSLLVRTAASVQNGTRSIAAYPTYVLLGDPTIKYNFTKPQNKCPYILNDLIDSNAYPGKPFKICFDTTDPENDPVFLDVDGLPEGAAYDSSTKTMEWVPQALQAGKSYEVTLTAYNKDTLGTPINKYVQEFTIHVSRMGLLPQEIPNPGFESLNSDGTPSGWTQISDENSLAIDSTVKNSGNYSARITDGYFDLYELNTNVEPNTHYLISGYIKTSNVETPYDTGAYLEIPGATANDCVFSNSIAGTQDWTPVYLHWYSGNNTSLKMQCRLGGSGTAWFDDIKLEKDYNLGFEFYPRQDSSSGIAKWSTINLKGDQKAVSLDSSVMRSGLRSVKIVSALENYVLMGNDIPVEPNTNYRVSAWVKTSDIIGGGLKLAVICGSNTVNTEPVLGTDTEWKQIYVDLNSGDNTKIRVNLKLGELSQLATGTAWIDDLAIEKK
ncbi:MAG TPA: cellulose binding domain-containing protein [Ruminiclostridium sp.]|nr:cellulose binding domain-containing protein [Ruminiclostridium sp.]